MTSSLIPDDKKTDLKLNSSSCSSIFSESISSSILLFATDAFKLASRSQAAPRDRSASTARSLYCSPLCCRPKSPPAAHKWTAEGCRRVEMAVAELVLTFELTASCSRLQVFKKRGSQNESETSMAMLFQENYRRTHNGSTYILTYSISMYTRDT